MNVVPRSTGNTHRGQKIFSLPRVVPCFPLRGTTFIRTLTYMSIFVRRKQEKYLFRLKTVVKRQAGVEVSRSFKIL